MTEAPGGAVLQRKGPAWLRSQARDVLELSLWGKCVPRAGLGEPRPCERLRCWGRGVPATSTPGAGSETGGLYPSPAPPQSEMPAKTQPEEAALAPLGAALGPGLDLLCPRTELGIPRVSRGSVGGAAAETRTPAHPRPPGSQPRAAGGQRPLPRGRPTGHAPRGPAPRERCPMGGRRARASRAPIVMQI